MYILRVQILCCLVVSVLSLDGIGNLSLAQTDTIYRPKQENPDSLFSNAYTLQQSNQYKESTKILAQLIRINPTYIDHAYGSAWYLLGKAVLSLNGEERAFRIWLQGIDVLKKANVFDPNISHEFVRLTMRLEKVKYFQMATELYYEFLDKVDVRLHAELLQKIYAQCVFLLPEEMLKTFVASYTLFEKKSTLGSKLREYWRNQDPTPVTKVNERLMEHLKRVVYAEKQFSSGNTRGFDDRGMIYIKLGPPVRKATAMNIGVRALKKEGILPHEVWSYEFIKRGLYFAFVDFGRKKGFKLVDSIDKAISLGLGIKSRIAFYNELGFASPIIYRRVHDILNLLHDDLNNYTRINSAKLQIQQHMAEIDYEIKQLRADNTPDFFTNVLLNVKEVPIQVRTARFLEEDGATRLEMYFGFRKNDLMMKSLEPLLPSDTLHVKLAVTAEDNNLRPGVRRKQTITVFTGNDRLDDEMELFDFAQKSPHDSFYVSGQVEIWYSKSGTAFDSEDNSELKNIWQDQDTPTQKLIKLTTFRTDLQKALRLERSPMLISDIQLSSEILTDADNPSPNKGELYIAPYPYSRVDRKQLLYLYFEIYGLELPEDGEAKYRIAYEAEVQKAKQSFWSKIRSIFGGAKKGKVELESEYTSKTQNPHEWIAFDLKALKPGEVNFTVKVTDLHSGATAERSVIFDLK